MKAILAPWLRRAAECRQALMAGLAGIVLGSALGFALLGWGICSTQVVIFGVFGLERVAMRDGVGGIDFGRGRLREP